MISGGVLLRDFLVAFEAAAKAVDLACLLIAAPEGALAGSIGDDAYSEIARPLIAAAQGHDVAALLPGRAALAKQLGADGVHLDLRAANPEGLLRVYREARGLLAEDAIVGVLCPVERHAAMDAAEAGADYVGFTGPDTAEMIDWWGELMTVPCVAFGSFEPSAARDLARSGADFIAPEPEIWGRADPLAALAEINAALR